jgi:hypothetical protein
MIIYDQKKKEYVHLLAFRECISDFPEGQVCLDVKHPDFLIKSATKTIGIEHTEVYHEPRKDASSLQATETYVYQILRRAKEIHGNLGHKPAFVWLDLSSGAGLNKAKVESLAITLADIVQARMPANLQSTEISQTWNDKNVLPREFSSVTIFRVDGQKDPSWGAVMAGAIPDIPSEFVQARIDQKNGRIRKYRAHCDEVWLLIVVYGFLPSTWLNVSGEALKQTYQSSFDRTYLFGFQQRRAIQLSTQVPQSK